MSLYNFIKYNNCISWLSFPALYDKITLSECAITGTATEYLLANGTKALYFNGASYINGLDYTVGSTFTISLWFNKTVTSTTNSTLYDSGNADNSDKIMIYTTSANVLHAKVVANNSLSRDLTYTVELNQWYHVVMVRSSSTLYLYVNGILVNSIADTLSVDTQTQITIGRLVTGSPLCYFTGVMKNVMVFNTQLTTKQIQKLYYYLYIS